MKQKLIAYIKANWMHLSLVVAAAGVKLLSKAGVIDNHTANEIAGGLVSLGVFLSRNSGTTDAVNNTTATNQDATKQK